MNNMTGALLVHDDCLSAKTTLTRAEDIFVNGSHIGPIYIPMPYPLPWIQANMPRASKAALKEWRLEEVD